VLSDEKDEWGRRWECVRWNEASSEAEERKVNEKVKGKGKAREKGVSLSELTVSVCFLSLVYCLVLSSFFLVEGACMDSI